MKNTIPIQRYITIETTPLKMPKPKSFKPDYKSIIEIILICIAYIIVMYFIPMPIVIKIAMCIPTIVHGIIVIIRIATPNKSSISKPRSYKKH